MFILEMLYREKLKRSRRQHIRYKKLWYQKYINAESKDEALTSYAHYKYHSKVAEIIYKKKILIKENQKKLLLEAYLIQVQSNNKKIKYANKHFLYPLNMTDSKS